MRIGGLKSTDSKDALLRAISEILLYKLFTYKKGTLRRNLLEIGLNTDSGYSMTERLECPFGI